MALAMHDVIICGELANCGLVPEVQDRNDIATSSTRIATEIDFPVHGWKYDSKNSAPWIILAIMQRCLKLALNKALLEGPILLSALLSDQVNSHS